MTMSTVEPVAKPKFSDVANKYLQIYNSDIDWLPHIKEVLGRLRASGSKDAADAEMRKRLTCAILLPYYEKNSLQNPPQNLLYYCHKWSQYTSRDWEKEFDEILTKDKKIESIRTKCLDLGIIYPLQYNPNTRQAFNWLYDEAVASGDLTDDNKADITKRLQNIVYAYGGVVVCSIFQKPELKTKIKNLSNWRSGYFFERLIHEIYGEDELIKIKTHELNKTRNTDPKLIKKINTTKD